ncbi:hypothetical protein HF324_27710 [Chitinophaga oryzae]|uniref:Uncharacterized protein n=1 Tax=Chitinophaga oryzae TaxID=2725414 RepID=A0AAE6ZLG1_9BACT|nr:hypothetical protein [Chitinophaga oryzae]QJB34912.1 hypothetical protein HF329_27850 [Chitinophaga oryzae]QJB41423.1 hypothetical protein HF324_27710 [Chitinophaga oryzae]
MNQERLMEYIRSYQELLAEKHYDDATLGNGHPADTIKLNLQKGFLEYFSDGNSNGEGFLTLQTYGKLGPGKELVGITFDFYCNENLGTIDLKQMAIYNNTGTIIIETHSNSGIPDLEEIYTLLKENEKADQKLGCATNRRGFRPF